MKSTEITVEPFSMEDSAVVYDIFVGAVGYETRATHAAKVMGNSARARVSAPFVDNHVLSFERNMKFFSEFGDVLSAGVLYRQQLKDYVASYIKAKNFLAPGGVVDERCHLVVDVSSMSRARIANTILALYVDLPYSVTVDWIYSPAKFSSRLLESGPVRVNDAVPGFEGWGDPIMPISAVVGVGLEGELILGVLDELEPSEVVLFKPVGLDHRYDAKISQLNEDVYRSVSGDSRFDYDVHEPFVSFLRLTGVVNELAEHSRVVLLPLGPKVFAVMCMLIGVSERRNVTVWRLSADAQTGPIDRVPNGDIVGLRANSSYIEPV